MSQPQGNSSTTYQYLGSTGTIAFDLIYGEVNGSPADLSLTTSMIGPAVVPEPASMAMVAFGLIAVGGYSIRRRKLGRLTSGPARVNLEPPGPQGPGGSLARADHDRPSFTGTSTALPLRITLTTTESPGARASTSVSRSSYVLTGLPSMLTIRSADSGTTTVPYLVRLAWIGRSPAFSAGPSSTRPSTSKPCEVR